MQRQEVTFVCPKGRKTRRTVTGRGRVQIRCSCGCGYVYTVHFR